MAGGGAQSHDTSISQGNVSRTLTAKIESLVALRFVGLRNLVPLNPRDSNSLMLIIEVAVDPHQPVGICEIKWIVQNIGIEIPALGNIRMGTGRGRQRIGRSKSPLSAAVVSGQEVVEPRLVVSLL